MSYKEPRKCSFDLVDIRYAEDERSALVLFEGRDCWIRMKKIGDGPGFVPWFLPSKEVEEVFGDCFVNELTSFIGRLVEKCYSRRGLLPLRDIRIEDVEKAADSGADEFNRFIATVAGVDE